MKIVGLRHQYISVKISYLACKLWASEVFAVCGRLSIDETNTFQLSNMKCIGLVNTWLLQF